MKVKRIIEKSLRFNEGHLKLIVADLSHEQLTTCPAMGLENHPAWTIGHLFDASEMCCEMLGGKNNLSEEWQQLFRRTGPGDTTIPSSDASLYPDKNTLQENYIKSHDTLLQLLKQCDEEKLNQPIQWSFAASFPTVIEVIHFTAAWHETHHIAQLEAWRRGMGLKTCLRPLADGLKAK